MAATVIPTLRDVPLPIEREETVVISTDHLAVVDLIECAAGLQAMFPAAQSVTFTYLGSGNYIMLVFGHDEDAVSAANLINAPIRKVTLQGLTWIEAQVLIGKTRIIVNGPAVAGRMPESKL